MSLRNLAEVLAERDAIQANLVELDDSFAKRMLEGATLTGRTRERWTTAAAAMAGLWETYLAYSAVVDRAASLGGAAPNHGAPNHGAPNHGARRPSREDLAEQARLLGAASVELPSAPLPLAQRDLAGTSRTMITLDDAVERMRRAFAAVTEVTAAVEAVWAAVGPPLDAAAADLAQCRPALAGLGAEAAAEFRAAESDLEAQRALSSADPLALWSGTGPVDTSAVDTGAAVRLQAQTTALVRRIAELDRLRAQAQGRIDALRAATEAARADRREAADAWQRAAARVAGLPPLPPAIAEPPLASLGALAASGQWSRLQAELDRCEAELATAVAAAGQARQQAADAVGRRDELRGLLGAYRAKAARLGGAEDEELTARHDRARELLWAAPCDLAAAEAAVSEYQRAILATEGRR